MLERLPPSACDVRGTCGVQPVFTSGDKKMKNIYVFILCLPLILSCKQKKQSTPTYDNSWCAVEMEEQYVGTYLPKEFIETLHNTKSYVKSMNSKPNGNHIIAVEKNIVYGDDDYYDQYAYPKEDVETFVFENENNEMVLIYDGNKYLRISNSPDYYEAMMPFVLKNIFENYKNINMISYNKIEISNEVFKFLPSIGFYEYETMPELFLADSENQYACRIQKGKMELRKLVENSLMTSKESEGVAKFFVLEN